MIVKPIKTEKSGNSSTIDIKMQQDVAARELICFSGCVGVTFSALLQDEVGAIQIDGIYEGEIAVAESATVGDKIYLDTATDILTTTANSNYVGRVTADKETGSSVVEFKIIWS